MKTLRQCAFVAAMLALGAIAWSAANHQSKTDPGCPLCGACETLEDCAELCSECCAGTGGQYAD